MFGVNLSSAGGGGGGGASGSGGGVRKVRSRSRSPRPPDSLLDVLSFLPGQPDSGDLFSGKFLSAEEKYRALEARDKILRARLPKGKVSVEFAIRLFGTCGDMCPEKERYMRQYQRQLTSLETLPNSGPELLVDHTKAIKVYSRSSADQEEPLPHDLRPGSTLEMTMNYLLHNIVPMAEGSELILGDWYNFLWDRTRSIRKDITQQQLTNLLVVGLMEKCARFHIHCGSRLCELDVHTFDPKLNDENLMKCLQSLEHLYDDLRRKGVQCPNEPEFRAYQIMMNLNEGDVLWEVQQRPEWILKSPEVQAAIKVHHCIYNRNFVGFFRLVKSFPYMFSCILHRYFYQVRFGALISLCRSGAGRKPEVQLVLPQVQRMLGYGQTASNEDVAYFCESHGLVMDPENDRIFYNRKRFVRPDSKIITREINLIEYKLTTSVAEAINGSSLGENPALTYNPHSSFNEDGTLKGGPLAGENSMRFLRYAPKGETGTSAAGRITPTYSRLKRPDPITAPSVPSIRTPTTEKKEVETRKQTVEHEAAVTKGEAPTFSFHAPPSDTKGKSLGPFQTISAGLQEFQTAPIAPVNFSFGKSLEENKVRRLQTIDSVCKETFNQISQKLMSRLLQTSVDRAVENCKQEQRKKERLKKREELRTNMTVLASGKILHNLVSIKTRELVVQETRRHRWVQRMCDAYGQIAMDHLIPNVIRSICQEMVYYHRNEHEKLLQRLSSIFRRIRIRFVVLKWRAFVSHKRAIKEDKRREAERLCQRIMDFPAVSPTFRSATQVLQQFRGNNGYTASPNLVKAGSSTSQWLNKYENAESLAEAFNNSVVNFISNLSPTFHKSSEVLAMNDTADLENLSHVNVYNRQAWKRRWSDVAHHEDADNIRRDHYTPKKKSPRLRTGAFYDYGKESHEKREEPYFEKSPEVKVRPQAQPLSSPKAPHLQLLEDIKKLTEEARKEKKKYESIERQIDEQLACDNS